MKKKKARESAQVQPGPILFRKWDRDGTRLGPVSGPYYAGWGPGRAFF